MVVVVIFGGCGVADAQLDLASAQIRVATFNTSLNRNQAGKLIEDLSQPDHQQARQLAEILQRVRPAIVLLNEFDYDKEGKAARLFQDH